MRFRSNECGGGTQNNNYCVRWTNLQRFLFVTWCVVQLEVVIRGWVPCSHELRNVVSYNTCLIGAFNRTFIGTRIPIQFIYRIITPPLSSWPLIQVKMDSYFCAVYVKFWFYHLCSYLTEVALGVIFCWCTSSASGFHMFCIHSRLFCSPSWLFELKLIFSQLDPD